MFSEIYTVGSGMIQQMQRQELIAENLAGSNLSGFKGRHLVGSEFAQLMADATGDSPATSDESGIPPVVVTDLEQGGLKPTERALDFALIGKGFFEVVTADDQVLLTRNGNFMLNGEGALVTQEGHRVQGSGGDIRFVITDSVQNTRASEDGTISVLNSDGSERQLGKLRIVQMAQPERLERLSANYYVVPDGMEPTDAQEAQVVNGYQEGANVSPIREMAAMIQSVREFEMGQKILQMISDRSRQEQQKLQA